MAKIKILLGLLTAIVIAGLGWWISSENSQLVSPRLLGISLPSWNLGIWMLIMLLIGGVSGYVLSLISYLKLRNRSRILRRDLARCEQELNTLRTASLRD